MVTRFTKEDRSTFPYWFAHWCAYQMVALNLGVWKFRYLFHDWYKPWLRLFMDYKKVQRFHRTHSRHHLEYKGEAPLDYVGMVIDWEASQYTKSQCPLNAYETCNEFYPWLKPIIYPILMDLGLYPDKPYMD